MQTAVSGASQGFAPTRGPVPAHRVTDVQEATCLAALAVHRQGVAHGGLRARREGRREGGHDHAEAVKVEKRESTLRAPHR